MRQTNGMVRPSRACWALVIVRYEQEGDDEQIPAHEVKLYQALVALIQDRSDMQCSVKELARPLPSPTQKSMGDSS